MLAEVGWAVATLGETLKPPPQYTGSLQVTLCQITAEPGRSLSSVPSDSFFNIVDVQFKITGIQHQIRSDQSLSRVRLFATP